MDTFFYYAEHVCWLTCFACLEAWLIVSTWEEWQGLLAAKKAELLAKSTAWAEEIAVLRADIKAGLDAEAKAKPLPPSDRFMGFGQGYTSAPTVTIDQMHPSFTMPVCVAGTGHYAKPPASPAPPPPKRY